MKKSNKFILISVVILLIVIIGAILNNYNKNNKNEDYSVNVYFYNKQLYVLESEKRILVSESNEDKVNEIIDILKKGPMNQNLSTVNNGDILSHIKSVDLDEDNNVTIECYSVVLAYEDLTKTLARSSVVLSLTDLSFVKNVDIIIKKDGIETVSHNNKTNVLLNPIIDPAKVVLTSFVLYFGNNTTTYLTKEERSMHINPDIAIEKYIIEELIAGTKDELNNNLIPKETKLIEVTTENNICFVNLSEEFATKISSDEYVQKLAIYSIVNALTELYNIEQVQILVNYKRLKNVEIFKDNNELNVVTFYRDESLIR